MINHNSVANLFCHRIRYVESNISWDEALQQTIGLLQSDGIVDENYLSAIRKVTEETGPYYILTDGLAMPHARPDEGVVEGMGGLSLLVCKVPVCFDDEHATVKVFIGLAAGNSDQHVLTISTLMNWLDSDDALSKLMTVNNEDALVQLVQTAEIYEPQL